MTALSILLGRALTASVLPVELLVFYQVILPSVLYRGCHTLWNLEGGEDELYWNRTDNSLLHSFNSAESIYIYLVTFLDL